MTAATAMSTNNYEVCDGGLWLNGATFCPACGAFATTRSFLAALSGQTALNQVSHGRNEPTKTMWFLTEEPS